MRRRAVPRLQRRRRLHRPLPVRRRLPHQPDPFLGEDMAAAARQGLTEQQAAGAGRAGRFRRACRPGPAAARRSCSPSDSSPALEPDGDGGDAATAAGPVDGDHLHRAGGAGDARPHPRRVPASGSWRPPGGAGRSLAPPGPPARHGADQHDPFVLRLAAAGPCRRGRHRSPLPASSTRPQADTLLFELIDRELRRRLAERDEAVLDLVVQFGLGRTPRHGPPTARPAAGDRLAAMARRKRPPACWPAGRNFGATTRCRGRRTGSPARPRPPTILEHPAASTALASGDASAVRRACWSSLPRWPRQRRSAGRPGGDPRKRQGAGRRRRRRPGPAKRSTNAFRDAAAKTAQPDQGGQPQQATSSPRPPGPPRKPPCGCWPWPTAWPPPTRTASGNWRRWTSTTC